MFLNACSAVLGAGGAVVWALTPARKPPTMMAKITPARRRHVRKAVLRCYPTCNFFLRFGFMLGLAGVPPMSTKRYALLAVLFGLLATAAAQILGAPRGSGGTPIGT